MMSGYSVEPTILSIAADGKNAVATFLMISGVQRVEIAVPVMIDATEPASALWKHAAGVLDFTLQYWSELARDRFGLPKR